MEIKTTIDLNNWNIGLAIYQGEITGRRGYLFTFLIFCLFIAL